MICGDLFKFGPNIYWQLPDANVQFVSSLGGILLTRCSDRTAPILATQRRRIVYMIAALPNDRD
jgi:hypothetical protein